VLTPTKSAARLIRDFLVGNPGVLTHSGIVLLWARAIIISLNQQLALVPLNKPTYLLERLEHQLLLR
jgi:hypothetical protein